MPVNRSRLRGLLSSRLTYRSAAAAASIVAISALAACGSSSPSGSSAAGSGSLAAASGARVRKWFERLFGVRSDARTESCRWARSTLAGASRLIDLSVMWVEE